MEKEIVNIQDIFMADISLYQCMSGLLTLGVSSFIVLYITGSSGLEQI